jgi:hypothetical protein
MVSGELQQEPIVGSPEWDMNQTLIDTEQPLSTSGEEPLASKQVGTNEHLRNEGAQY